MDRTADTQRIGVGLNTGVRKIGLHASCQEKISYLLLIGGLTSSFECRESIQSLMVFSNIYVDDIEFTFSPLAMMQDGIFIPVIRVK